MEPLTYIGPVPQDLRDPPLVAAFSGWADAQEGATRAVRYLVRSLGAVRFAVIDPEEFYDFTQVRPTVYLDEDGERRVRWPSNEFYYYRTQPPGRDLVLFVGTEPNLRWKTFASLVLEVARRCNVTMVATLGALLDAVPHTREPRVSGSATGGELRRALEGLGVRGSGYQGPTGMPSALMEACARQGYACCSLWAHTPHYLQVTPNPKATRALLQRLGTLLGFQPDLRDLEARESVFDTEVRQAVERNPEVAGYVRRLEEQYDKAMGAGAELPDPQSVVQDLEAFLRRQTRPPQEGGPTP